MSLSVAFAFDLHETVRIPALACDGIVTARLDCLNGIKYEIVWWNNGARQSAYLFAWEIRPRERKGNGV
jgi:hypothetical protein